MKVGVPKEITPGERRVALVPDSLAVLKKAGLETIVESGAGAGAYRIDSEYEKAGAVIVPDPMHLLGEAEILVKVRAPTVNEASRIREGAILVSFLQPAQSLDLVRAL